MRIFCITALWLGSAGFAWSDDAADLAKFQERRRTFEIARRSKHLEDLEAAYKSAPKETDLNVARNRAFQHQREVAAIKAEIAYLNKAKGFKPAELREIEVGAIGYISRPLKDIRPLGPTEFNAVFPSNGNAQDPQLLVRGFVLAKVAENAPKSIVDPNAKVKKDEKVKEDKSKVKGKDDRFKNRNKVEEYPEEKEMTVRLPGLVMVSSVNITEHPDQPRRFVYVIEPLDVAKATKEFEAGVKKLGVPPR